MPAQLQLATEIGWLQRAVIEKLRTRPASVLDLGCGSRRPFGILADTVVGIDSDERALRANRSLTSAICADLTEFDLGSNAYDVIVCWNVLEHVREPAPVLARMSRALRSGGVLVLAFPNVGSARGLLTRFTPTFVHRAALRHVLGGRNSDPYPTKLRGDHTPRRILENAHVEHLVPFHVRLYEGYYERRLQELRPTLYELWSSAVRLLGRASFGRVDSRTDVLMAFEKLHNSHAHGQPPTAGG
jgi:2-polyprenyl-3-methyl-5-hydroxy-6-metoxy-1,4-benzoquinol methylase